MQCKTCGLQVGRDFNECDPTPLDNGETCRRRAEKSAMKGALAEIDRLRTIIKTAQHRCKLPYVTEDLEFCDPTDIDAAVTRERQAFAALLRGA